jgi:hypothetical protein
MCVPNEAMAVRKWELEPGGGTEGLGAYLFALLVGLLDVHVKGLCHVIKRVL